MMTIEKSFKHPQKGKALTGIVASGVKSPFLPIKFCNLVHPYYYPNSLKIPRYSLTVLVDPEEHEEFANQILELQQRERCQPVLKEETKKEKESMEIFSTGYYVLKFQGKEVPEMKKLNGKKLKIFEITEELPSGTLVEVTFDILRYFKLGAAEKGISMRPTSVIIKESP